MDSASQQQRIVVGISGSLNSLVALRRAGTEARLTERRLLAVMVWRPHVTDPPVGTGRSTLKGTRTAAMSLLKDILNDVFAASDDGVPIGGLVISGNAGDGLYISADRNQGSFPGKRATAPRLPQLPVHRPAQPSQQFTGAKSRKKSIA